MFLSSVGSEHYLDKVGVVGSSPTGTTNRMRKFKLLIVRTYTSVNSLGLNAMALLKKDQRLAYGADMVYAHTYASEYNGKIIKFRRGEGKAGHCHLDDLVKKFNHLPRKEKKSIKKYVASVVDRYKREDK